MDSSENNKKKVNIFRLIYGSAVMALLYCLMIFIVPLRAYMSILVSIIILMIGVIISFKPSGINEFLQLTALAHISAFALGGMGIALFYFTNIGNVIGNMIGFTVHNLSLKILLASTCTFYIIIRFLSGWLQHNIIKNQVLYPVTIYFKEAVVDITALLDTGNSLRDPIGNVPVIVAEFDAIKNCLPDCIKILFCEKNDTDLSSLPLNLDNSDFNIRMIPFVSLGRQNGMLLGFKPDKVEITNDNVVCTINDVIIGIYNFNLSRAGNYQGLLNPELISNNTK